MRSFQKVRDPRRATYLRLVAQTEGGLREAYAKRFGQGRLNKAVLARTLGVHPSVITRRLTGGTNLTLESVADLVWGMDHAIEVRIYDPFEAAAFDPLMNDRPSAPSAVGAAPSQTASTLGSVFGLDHSFATAG